MPQQMYGIGRPETTARDKRKPKLQAERNEGQRKTKHQAKRDENQNSQPREKKAKAAG